MAQKTLQNPRRVKRTLAFLQVSRCGGCPVCGAGPFELCRNIPGDPLTGTRWVHNARLARIARKPALKVTYDRARARLEAGRQLRSA